MAWANPSSGDDKTRIYHLCSLGWKLPAASKDEILQVLSVISKRGEWAERGISEPRNLPDDADLLLVRNGCSWKEVPVRLLQILKRPFIINPFARNRFQCKKIVHPAGCGRSTMRMFACSPVSRQGKIL